MMEDIQIIEKYASECVLCELHKGRNKAVFARGYITEPSSVMICGMCPGADENKIGFPFVGAAGKILDILIHESGINRYYITNLVKCFVKPGITLKQEWMTACLPYFISQIGIIKPVAIIGLGADVCNFLTDIQEPIGKLRGKEFKYFNIPFICSYHPSYYARGGGAKHRDFSKGLNDFSMAKNIQTKVR